MSDPMDKQEMAPQAAEAARDEDPMMAEAPTMGEPVMHEDPMMAEAPTMGEPAMHEDPMMAQAPQEAQHESFLDRVEHLIHHDRKE